MKEYIRDIFAIIGILLTTYLFIMFFYEYTSNFLPARKAGHEIEELCLLGWYNTTYGEEYNRLVEHEYIFGLWKFKNGNSIPIAWTGYRRG